MKNKLLFICLALVLGILDVSASELIPSTQQSQAALLSAEVLSRYHYRHIPLNDISSEKIFDNYLKALDGEKLFFLQSDLALFSPARKLLDDAIIKQNLTIPFAIYNLYQQRVTERVTFARSLLTRGFDFSTQEDYPLTRKNAAWSTSTETLNDVWRRRVKNDWLRLKLAGKDDSNIVETLNKRYDNTLAGLNKIKSDDVFQQFMTAYTMAIDPHTDYLGMRASEDFDISMKLSLTGIGAVLQDKDEYTTIRELVAGGPAALSGKLKVGDRIVGVGQDNNPPVDVMGWRIDDTVALIRGAENSTVRLDVLPAEAGPDGAHKLISLVRKTIRMDKQAAKKSIIEVKDAGLTRRIGVITLPGFYLDFSARQKGIKDFKSATRDVALLLAEFKKEKVDSVLIDLRNNGGGSLDEAIELTGLFIDKGPVVQQRDSQGQITVSSDTHAGLAWSGPLGVLINRASASASEIFAAAIQDYGRGILIGETSFGKGTVQSVINLDQLVKNDKPKYGELKMTVAQFFRINGGTTQLRGVTPDVTLPSLIDEEEFGESSYDNALPWTKIKAANYTKFGNLAHLIPRLTEKHRQRVAHSTSFQDLEQDIADFNLRRKNNSISLNETERRNERTAQGIKLKLRDQEQPSVANSNQLQDDGLQSNERKLDDELAIEKARKNTKDIVLDEAVHIVSDEADLLKTDPKQTVTALHN